jgi:hypothetical protein
MFVVVEAATHKALKPGPSSGPPKARHVRRGRSRDPQGAADVEAKASATYKSFQPSAKQRPAKARHVHRGRSRDLQSAEASATYEIVQPKPSSPLRRQEIFVVAGAAANRRKWRSEDRRYEES